MCEEIPYQEDAESYLKRQESRGKKPVFFAVLGWFVVVVKHVSLV